MSRRAVHRALVPLLATAALVLSGCGLGGDAGLGYLTGQGTVTRLSPVDRPAAPAVRGTTMEGGWFDLAAYRGQVVVLTFWASWCPPCRAETPAIQEVATAMRTRGVAFVGIATRENDRDAANAFLRRFGSTYPNIDDADSRVALAFQQGAIRLPPELIPSILVVDRQGRIAARILGPTTQPRLTALLTSVAAEAA